MHNTRLLQNDIVLIVHPQLIRAFGEKQARFLSQFHYWLGKETLGKIHEGKRWVFNTFDAIADQLCISVRQAKRITAELSKLGVIQIQKLAEYKSNRTNYYTINYERLDEVLLELGIDQSTGNNKPLNLTKKAPWECQNGTMVNSEKTNKKEFNKSDKIDPIVIEEVGEGTQEIEQYIPHPVHQVKNIKSNVVEENAGESTPTIKNTTAQDMLAHWNKTFPGSQVSMSRDLAPLLVSAFKSKFALELNKWKHYCQTIESSDYLTGSEFKLSLYWALKYQTIDRIGAGEFGVKSVPVPGEPQRLEHDFISQIEGLTEPEECKIVRLMLLKAYGPMVYKSWFQALTFYVEGENVLFTAPTPFHGDYVARTYPELLM